MTETKNNQLVAQNFRLWSYVCTTVESMLMKFDQPYIGSSEYSLAVFSVLSIGLICLIAKFTYISYVFTYFTNISINLGILSAMGLLIFLGL